MVVNLNRRESREERQSAVVRGVAPIRLERSPGRNMLGLGDAPGVLAGMPEGRLVDLAGRRSCGVDDDQPDRAPNCRVGKVPWAEYADAGVQADLRCDRAVDNHQRRGALRARGDRMEIELWLAHRLDRGRDDPEILGSAPGHDGIDRGLFSRDHSALRRLSTEDVGRGAANRFKARCNQLRGRGNDGKTVRPTAFGVPLDDVVPRVELDLRGA